MKWEERNTVYQGSDHRDILWAKLRGFIRCGEEIPRKTL